MAKIPKPRRLLLQTRAAQLLREGNDEGTAESMMVAEELCSEAIAKKVVEWVRVYGWPSLPTQRKRKKT